jgi:regulator of protease activity HflC (stomatin/prohibitin superfamily)
MEWLNKLVESLLKLVPTIWLIGPDEGGVRVTLGKLVKDTPSGWYFYWPLIQTCYKITIVQQVVDLRCQSVQSKDGTTCIVSAAIKYHVPDPRKAILTVESYDAAVQRMVYGLTVEYISTNNFDDIDALKISQFVEEELTEQMEAWGMELEQVFITDFCKCKSHRIIHGDGVLASVSLHMVS